MLFLDACRTLEQHSCTVIKLDYSPITDKNCKYFYFKIFNCKKINCQQKAQAQMSKIPTPCQPLTSKTKLMRLNIKQLNLWRGGNLTCLSAEPQMVNTIIGRAAMTADDSNTIRHSVCAPVWTMVLVSSLLRMLNNDTTKNATPVNTPEKGGARWTKAVWTPGVCMPET